MEALDVRYSPVPFLQNFATWILANAVVQPDGSLIIQPGGSATITLTTEVDKDFNSLRIENIFYSTAISSKNNYQSTAQMFIVETYKNNQNSINESLFRTLGFNSKNFDSLALRYTDETRYQTLGRRMKEMKITILNSLPDPLTIYNLKFYQSIDVAHTQVNDLANSAIQTTGTISTDDYIQRYLAKDQSDARFVKVVGAWEYWISATTDGTTAQLEDYKFDPMFWSQDITTATVGADGYPYINGLKVGITTVNTGFPVSVYKYTEFIKRRTGYDDQGIVRDFYGVGTDLNNPSLSTGQVYKDGTSFDHVYITNNGTRRGLYLSDDRADYEGLEYAVEKMRTTSTARFRLPVFTEDPLVAEIGEMCFIDPSGINPNV